jgi:deoxyribodipyrimidine photo-lyase
VPGHSFLSYRRAPRRGDPFALRVTVHGPENPRGDYLLYWMQSARRLRNNLALEYAISQANAAKLPLVVYESLRSEEPWANDRIHSFVLEGVARNRADAKARGLRYVFANDAFDHLASRARLVITDNWWSGGQVVIDGHGILPIRVFEKEQYSAKFLRDRAHRLFPELWATIEEVEPVKRFRGSLDVDEYDGRDPRATARASGIDHSIAPVATIGGREAGLRRLAEFDVAGYAEGRNKSPRFVSGLSPYLHFGHLGVHEIAEHVLAGDAPGEDVDAFLEEAIIRRELSFNFCFYNPHHRTLASLPDWAKKTLDKHRGDRRKPVYSYEDLERAATHDEVWNLSQRQLLATGTIHGYLRMLWGKKIIEWSATPEEACATMIRLHDVYAIDGRDPNTYAGVLWCFGKHDRPWAPERPIFGSIRWMSSEQTAKKVRLKQIEALLD